MIGDTLNAAANSDTVQQIAVIIQAALVVIGGVLALFCKKGKKQ